MWGSCGVRVNNVAGAAATAGTAVVLQGDGQSIIGGVAGPEAFIARFNATGAYDIAFGVSGRRRVASGTQAAFAAVAQQPDGRIVGAGSTTTGGASDTLLARVTTSGTLDTSFSGDGILVADFGGGDSAAAVRVQGDGNIVVGGTAGSGGFVARYIVHGCARRVVRQRRQGDRTADDGAGARVAGRRQDRGRGCVVSRGRRLRAAAVEHRRHDRLELRRRQWSDDRLRWLRRGDRPRGAERRQGRRHGGGSRSCGRRSHDRGALHDRRHGRLDVHDRRPVVRHGRHAGLVGTAVRRQDHRDRQLEGREATTTCSWRGSTPMAAPTPASASVASRWRTKARVRPRKASSFSPMVARSWWAASAKARHDRLARFRYQGDLVVGRASGARLRAGRVRWAPRLQRRLHRRPGPGRRRSVVAGSVRGSCRRSDGRRTRLRHGRVRCAAQVPIR